MVLNLPNLQHPIFLERPSSQLLSKLPVDGFAFLARRRLNTRRKPLILETLYRAQNGKPRRVSGLHRGDKRQLRTSCCDVLRGRRIPFLRVVTVRGDWRAQYGRNKIVVVSKRLRNTPGEGQNTVAAEEGLGVLSQLAGSWEEQDVVLLSRRHGIIVEMIHHNGRTVVG